MTLKVSLVIDGNASGAKAAAVEAKTAVMALGSEGSAALHTLKASAEANVVSLARVRDELARSTTVQPAAFNASAINSNLRVTDDFGAAARKTDVDAYGVALDQVRAKYDPLFAAGMRYKEALTEINAAARVGAIDERVRAEAIQRTKDSFTQQVTIIRTGAAASGSAVKNLGDGIVGSSRAARAEMINLSRQAQDVGVSLASGQSPFMVLVQQGSQIFDVFSSSERSVGDFFKQAVSGAARFLTPTVLVTGAILGIGTAIVTAASQYGAAQRQIEVALTGIGRASGVMRSDINAIASDSASTFGLSVSEARNFATALAATGKIGKDNIAPIVALGHDVAIAYGEDAAGAAKLLANAFADPVKGATDLNARLGFLDAATLRQITNLQAQNRLYEAQALLQPKVKAGLEGIGQTLSSSAGFWTAIGNAISNTWDALGRGASRLTGIGFTQGLDEQIDTTKAKVVELQKIVDDTNNGPAPTGIRAAGFAGTLQELERQKAKLEELQSEWQRYRSAVEGAQQRRDSFAQSAAVEKALPEISQLRDLNNNYLNLSLTLAEVNRTGGESSPMLVAMGKSYAQLAQAIAEAKGQVDAFKSSNDRAIAGLELQIGAVGKRSPGALGDLARQQSLLSQGSASPDAQRQAELTGTLARRQAEQQIADARAQSLLTARQATDAAGLELSILGRGSIEQERQRSILQAKQQLEQQSLQTNGSREAYDRGHLKSLEDEINKQAALKQQLAEQQTIRDLSFERAQIGRTSDEQQVASRLRGIYGDDYAKQLDGSIAGQMRLNQQLQSTHDIGLGVYKGILSDLQQGKTAGETFGNALVNSLQKVSDKLAEMAFNNLWSAAFGGNSAGGLLGGLFGGGSAPLSLDAGGSAGAISTGSAGGTGGVLGGLFGDGGYTGDVGTRAVAGVVHGQEFVINAGQTAKHRALLEDINAGAFPGYMGGGYVGPAQLGSRAPGAVSEQPITLTSEIRLYVDNKSGAPVKATAQKGPPGFDMAVLLEGISNGIAQDLSDGKGPITTTLTREYGMRRSFG
ncbi:MAG: hypothetical protein GC182_03190 [Rhodopseudomonas sp.]|nr:hypothetical protein [Rhodopseudomonas sp.]